jgi:LysR family transcriptional regulator, glycine cleavage system transcriptional activator
MGLELPPLNTLRMFEAAGRLLNFRAAADELNVTPSAISHGIVVLETWLGARLFERGSQGLMLTEAAVYYLPPVRRALVWLADATERVPGRKARGSLTISVAPTFASTWLLPRMSRFSDVQPNVSITLDTTHRQVNMPRVGVDLVIRMAARRQANGIWFRLLKERLVPVIAPALSRQIAHRTPEDIFTNIPWIHVTSVRRDWSVFDDIVTRSPEQARHDLRFDTVHIAIQAATYGLGIALGRRPLIDEDIEAGRLVPLPVSERDADTSYWLVGLPTTYERPEVAAFRNWIMAELREGGGNANGADLAFPAT